MSSSGSTKSSHMTAKSPKSEPLLKAVTINDEPEHIGGPQLDDGADTDSTHSPRLHRANISGKKMTGRPFVDRSASQISLSEQMSQLNLPGVESGAETTEGGAGSPDLQMAIAKVVEWFHEEKARRAEDKARKRDKTKTVGATTDRSPAETSDLETHASGHDVALEKLGNILAGIASNRPKIGQGKSTGLRRGSIAKKMKRTSIVAASSDTEYQEGDLLVPNVEASLDNSKTMAYSGGAAEGDASPSIKRKDRENWNSFKQEIVRLTHTLKLKGWRRVPLENGADIEVKRLSGALTNAVYVVQPPKQLPEMKEPTGSISLMSKKTPMPLLLRVYGPQVGHLIDRDTELAILRRLARKRIGPRMLGTFSNGRFEEFFHAETLTAEDLRVPDTSKQIAKRMRELHDGIELLESERDAGPLVFNNWNKWVDRCEKVITWLDKQVLHANDETPAATNEYNKRGFICGVEWPVFRRTVEKYHRHLYETHGGKKGVRQQLVFAHNDTQYGNLMRLKPAGESPLLMPMNEHKQLVVIDFEYAGANTPGLEFANHFTEWCYNYHNQERSYALSTNMYPNQEEQRRFIRSYVMHRPQFHPSASATPKMDGRERTNIPDFMLDARGPPGSVPIDYSEEEKAREQRMEAEIQQLTKETRAWRVALSAQWVAWGIVQAKVPELDEKPKSRAAAVVDSIRNRMYPQSDPLDPEVKALQEAGKHDRPENRIEEEAHEEGDGEEGEEFDYLSYAQERAMFFWGDCLQMGFIKEDELLDSMKGKVKIVRY